MTNLTAISREIGSVEGQYMGDRMALHGHRDSSVVRWLSFAAS
jgi:hypothetical protein